MKSIYVVLLGALVALGSLREASASWFHPDLGEAALELERARGPSVYTALRRVWGTWDRANPAFVEAELAVAERATWITPSARSYAALLRAYARLRRGDLAASRERIRALGFIDRWFVVGPFDNEGRAGLEREFEPDLDPAGPIVPGRAFSGKERPVRWRRVPQVFRDGYLDLGALFRPDRKICGFAATTVSDGSAPGRARWISAWVGVGGAFRVYFNGEAVLEDTRYRLYDADRHAVALRLEPGPNRLLVKACGDGVAPEISIRLAKVDGSPDPTLTVSNELALVGPTLTGPGGGARAAGGTKASRAPGRPKAPAVLGPLAAFERIVAKAPTADNLERFARYLVLTGGDDPSEHKARDLARRAAELEPTLERLLLAGSLAEDRNLAADWLTKAHGLERAADSVDWLLAKALHERTGPNWQGALPYFDRVLAEDPNHLIALRSRVELYKQAGLERTGLSTLERALERQPDSVSLINMTASQLLELGRDREAFETERRYSALRFDDRGYLVRQVKLFVSRDDGVEAERWLGRLLDTNPSSLWALGFAAQTYRALGKPDRALESYQSALEIAPEDVETLRALGDLEGELGRRDAQLRTLKKILGIRPQDVAVRRYVEFLEPARPRSDEAYAWSKERFLPLRHAPPAGANQRTLNDLGVVTVFENGLSSEFRQVVFQPLTDAAAALSRQYAFQYRADRQAVQLRGARVYRASGRVDEAIEFGEAAANDPSIAMYTSTRNFYIQLPPLEPGDVVDLRYRIDDITPQNEFADYFGDVHYLEALEPVAHAEYVLITPKTRRLHIDARLQGLKRTTLEKGNQRIYRFEAERLAPVPLEPGMPPLSEVLGFVHVSTYASWDELGRWYWGLIKDQFDLDDETRKLARTIAGDKQTDLEKVKAVYGWVVENTRYVALEFGIYGYKPRRAVQTVARGWGDCKDKATVIVTLLEELGVDSRIVILRTGLRGAFHSKLASLAPFDHAIVYVPSLDLYLDGTAEHTGTGELPKLDVGALGLRVDQGKAELVTLPEADPESNVTERSVRVELAPNGVGRLQVQAEVRGIEAAEWRRRYSDASAVRERVAHDLGGLFPGFLIDTDAGGLLAEGLDDIERAPKLALRGVAPSFARRSGKELSMSVTPALRLTPDYASLSKRRQDLVLGAFPNLDETYEVKLPPGSRIVSRPPTVSASTPFGSYSLEVTEAGRVVSVRSRLRIKKPRVHPPEYPAFKRFAADVDKAFGTRLVIEL